MKRLLYSAFCLVLSFPLLAQNQKALTPEEEELKFFEYIQNSVERYERLLKLEDWQVFYVDSILTHNNTAIRDECKALQDRKVSNYDLYYEVQDKWNEATYQAFRRILDEEQWKKYLKSGAKKEKKARDKKLAEKAKKN